MKRDKKAIIQSIVKLLNPGHTCLAKTFFEAIEHPGKWRHEGAILTKDECIAIKARRRFFIVRASKYKSPCSLSATI